MMLKDSTLMQSVLKALGKQDTAALQAEYDSYKETAEAVSAALQEQVASLTAEKASLAEQVAKLQEQHDALQAQLDAIGAQVKAEAEKQAAEAAVAQAKKMEKRLAACKAAVGDEKGAELFEAIGDMPDAKFDAVVGAAAASYDLEAQRDADGVQGVEAEVVVTSAADNRVAELKAVVAQRCGKPAAK